MKLPPASIPLSLTKPEPSPTENCKPPLLSPTVLFHNRSFSPAAPARNTARNIRLQPPCLPAHSRTISRFSVPIPPKRFPAEGLSPNTAATASLQAQWLCWNWSKSPFRVMRILPFPQAAPQSISLYRANIWV